MAFWCCCAAGSKMYSCGGVDFNSTTFYATCDKTDMASETSAAASSGNLSSSRWGAGSAANPAVAGYFCGGSTSATVAGNVVTGDKLTFNNDTTSHVASSDLTYSAYDTTGLSERSTKAYFAGGQGSASTIATADKLTFSTDTNAAQASANLSTAREGPEGANGNSTKGYFAGGSTNGIGTGITNKADKIVFSTDTTAAQASANLSVGRRYVQAGGDGSTVVYWFCGATSNTVVDKTTVSTDTTAATTSALNNGAIARDSGASGSDGSTKLLALGGHTNTSAAVATGSKITFATDVSSALGSGANLSVARMHVAGVSTVAL